MIGDWHFGILPRLYPVAGVLFVLAVIWVMFLKLYGLWRAGRNAQPIWFVFMAILNTAGILPVIYLLFFQKQGLLRVRLGGAGGKKKIVKRKRVGVRKKKYGEIV